MKQLTKQQAIKAYLKGYNVVCKVNNQWQTVHKNTKLSASNEFAVVGC